MRNIIALINNIGWKHVQLDEVTELKKEWSYDNKEYKVNVFFGRLRSGKFTPVVIMNVYEQGAGTKHVVDDNCDIWKNIFTETTADEGNEYFRYLLKHGFNVVR